MSCRRYGRALSHLGADIDARQGVPRRRVAAVEAAEGAVAVGGRVSACVAELLGSLCV